MNRIKIFLSQHKWILSILVLGSFLRLYHLEYQSLWLDEIFSMNVSDPRLTFAEFNFEMLLREGFPYLYFFILKFFYLLFGYTVFAARFVSALAGIGGVFGIYILGKSVYSKNAGLLAAFLMAINEYSIFISQDARPYSLYVMATIFSYYGLSEFLKNPTLKNTLIYGMLSALLLNVNFFAFINMLSQACIILFFLVLAPRKDRRELFKYSVVAGVIAILCFLPNYKMLIKCLNFTSFWVNLPGPDSVTLLFREFLGNSEMTMFIFMPVFFYFVICLFRNNEPLSWQNMITSRLQFTTTLLFGWIFVFVAFLVLKSYLGISLMLTRYFTSITPVIYLVLAIGISMIRNKLARGIVVVAIGVFTVINLFAVKDYYNKVTKTQFREITADLLSKNKNNDKVVSSWGYLFNYYLKDKTGKNTIETPLDVYVNDMKNERVDNLSFWYIDANARPYQLSPDLEAYLNDNFVIDHQLEYYDTWAKHYKSKNANADVSFLILNNFKPSLFDGSGAMIFVENMTSKYPPIMLKKGVYDIVVKGVSLPDPPINSENAHFKIIINGTEAGSFNLSEKQDNPGAIVHYTNDIDQLVKLEVQYDNDAFVNNQDRNAILRSIQIKKK